jgi:hypothetical protein
MKILQNGVMHQQPRLLVNQERMHALIRVSVLFNMRQDMLEVLLTMLLKHQTEAAVSFDGYHPDLSKNT